MTDKEKLIYLAGIVDGEGTFWRGYSKNGRGERYLQSRLIVVQKEKPLIDWMKENFEGGVTLSRRMSFGIRRPIWRWSLNGKKCELLAKRLQPYMIVKREQIKRVLYQDN